MNVADVMDGLAARLDTISGLRVAAYPSDQVNPPQALVNFPESIADNTMAGGSQRATFPIHLLLKVTDIRSATKNLQPYLGTGATSIQAAIEGDKTLDGAAQSVSVIDHFTEYFTVGSIDYLAATFRVDVIA